MGKDSSLFKTGLLNSGLRAATLAGKFVLLFAIARFLPVGEVGLYGLVIITISLAVYVLGLDFYTYNTRELLKQDRHSRPRLIRDQFAFHGIAYLVVLPVLLLIFALNILPWKYAGWFYALLVLEHLSQESYRILITLSKPVLGNLVLFFRSGSWVYPLAPAMFLFPGARNLTTIWAAWAAGGIISLVIAAFSLRNMGWRKTVLLPCDWDWVLQGVRTSLPFFCSTAALLGITALSRYVLKFYSGNDAVGVYTFYVSIANVVQVFVDTGITSILLPKLVYAYQHELVDEYRRLMARFSRGLAVVVVSVSAFALVIIYPVLTVLDRPVYNSHMPVFWVLLASSAVASLGYIPHYKLYVRRKDRAVFISTAAGLVVAVAANLILVPRFAQMGAAIAMLCAMTAVVGGKMLYLALGGKT